MCMLLLMLLAVVLCQGHPCLCCGLHWQYLLALRKDLQAMLASGPRIKGDGTAQVNLSLSALQMPQHHSR